MTTTNQQIIGIVAVNSPDYVARAFEVLASGGVFVPLRNNKDADRIRLGAVSTVVEPKPGFGWIRPEYTSSSSPNPAMVAFTSGTEGKPKGVELSHGALGDVTERLREVMKITPEIREYLGVPVYHSFGFGRCRVVAAAGGQAYLPENGFDPLEVAEMLGRGEINAVSAVPSLWRTLLEGAQHFEGIGSKMRWIEIGSQYMSQAEKVELRRIFPQAKIVQHYGLTEASRSTFLEIDTTEPPHLESVGRAAGDVEVRISDDSRIMIRGPHVATRVISDDGSDHGYLDADGWYTTNDRGRIEEGYVYFEGRVDDVINCGGLKLSPELAETAVLARIGGHQEFAVCRVPDPVHGDGILLVVTPNSASQRQELAEALLAHAAESGINARGAIRYCEVDELPRTASGKVQRAKLTEAHAGAAIFEFETVQRAGESTSNGSGEPETERERQLLVIWQQGLGTSKIRVDESFYDLGGDSVTALTVVVRMSRAGIDIATCRKILQGATIRELARDPDQPGQADHTPGGVKAATPPAHRDYINTLLANTLRGLLVMAVITGHWSEGALNRLPPMFSGLSGLLAPYFQFGTPGFAVVFGAGFGYLYLERLRDNKERVWAATKIGTSILGFGVLLMAGISLAMRKDELTSASFFEIFYSALTFYLIAIPTLPLWGRLALRVPSRRRVMFLFALSPVCLLISEGFHFLLDDVRLDGFLRLVRLMLVAKYAYFRMMAGVMLGLATGDYVRQNLEEPWLSRRLSLRGLGVIGASLVIGGLLGELDLLTYWPAKLTTWKWLFFFGVVTVLWGGLLHLRDDYASLNVWVRRTIEFVATIGQLALPFYVFHETIRPMKAGIAALGAPDSVATLASISLFAVVATIMMRRVSRLFHSS